MAKGNGQILVHRTLEEQDASNLAVGQRRLGSSVGQEHQGEKVVRSLGVTCPVELDAGLWGPRGAKGGASQVEPKQMDQPDYQVA